MFNNVKDKIMGLAVIVPDADFSNVNLGQVTLTNPNPVRTLGIESPNEIIGANYKFTSVYTPANTNQRGVTWSIISGNEYATIDSSTGVLTILSEANSSSITVRVVSNDNQEVYATKEVVVTYNSSMLDWQDITQDMVVHDYAIRDSNGDIVVKSGSAVRDLAVIPIPTGATKYIFKVVGAKRISNYDISFLNQKSIPAGGITCTHFSSVDTTVIQSDYSVDLQSRDVSVVVWQQIGTIVLGIGNIQFKFEK